MGIYIFVSVILNAVSSAILDVTQFLIQLNSGWILQLMKGISSDRQKLLKYLRGTVIFASFNTPLSPAAAGFPKMRHLYLDDIDLSEVRLLGFPSLVMGNSYLLDCHKLPDMSKELSLYSIKLYIGIFISMFSAVSICSSFKWVMHFANDAVFKRNIRICITVRSHYMTRY